MTIVTPDGREADDRRLDIVHIETLRQAFRGELIFFYMHGAATCPLPTDTAFAARRAQWDVDGGSFRTRLRSRVQKDPAHDDYTEVETAIESDPRG